MDFELLQDRLVSQKNKNKGMDFPKRTDVVALRCFQTESLKLKKITVILTRPQKERPLRGFNPNNKHWGPPQNSQDVRFCASRISSSISTWRKKKSGKIAKCHTYGEYLKATLPHVASWRISANLRSVLRSYPTNPAKNDLRDASLSKTVL